MNAQTVEAGEILIVETFFERRGALTGGTTTVKFGGSGRAAFGSGEFSTLDADGRLPQNKTGRLSGVMIDIHDDMTGNEAEHLANLKTFLGYRQGARVDIYVGNVIVAQHQLGQLPASPPQLQFGTGTASSGWIGAHNGGWPLAFGEHPIEERQSLWVDIVPLYTIPTPTTGDLFATVTWQCKTRTPYTSRG